MEIAMGRRGFLKSAAAGSLLYLGGGSLFSAAAEGLGPGLLSPGARRSKVRVAKIYMGIPQALWPMPAMNLDEERRAYEAEIARRGKDFADVEFVVNELVTTPEQAQAAAEQVKEADGVLVIHLSMGIMPLLAPVLKAGKPTLLYAAPYSGHEWTQFGPLRETPEGALLECMLTSNFDDLAVAVRPFRAIHHLREAKILDVTARDPKADFLQAVKKRFGTEIQVIGRDRMLAVYDAISEADAETEAARWIEKAEAVVEPPKEEIVKSCRLALAFEKLLEEEKATAVTVECYGSMYHQLPAFPCIGFTRLNDMGFAGICESDLQSAMTFLMLQGLSGKPGFISDPTVDESKDAIILAHCLGSTKMDGPDGEACPYKLRTIMERQEGAVPQVRMRLGQKVTQAELIGTDLLLYFTGTVIETPDTERGCRTKITVQVDGDVERLWKHWSHGLHRVTCYGDLVSDLKRFCRFQNIKMTDEAAREA